MNQDDLRAAIQVRLEERFGPGPLADRILGRAVGLVEAVLGFEAVLGEFECPKTVRRHIVKACTDIAAEHYKAGVDDAQDVLNHMLKEAKGKKIDAS